MGLFQLIFSMLWSIIREVKGKNSNMAGTRRQKLMQRPWWNATYRKECLLLVTCTPCFLIIPGPPVQGEGTAHSGMGTPTSTINQENTSQTCARSIRWGHFSTKIPSSKRTPVALSWYKASQKMLHYLGLLHHSYKWHSQVLRLTLSGFLLSPLL